MGRREGEKKQLMDPEPQLAPTTFPVVVQVAKSGRRSRWARILTRGWTGQGTTRRAGPSEYTPPGMRSKN